MGSQHHGRAEHHGRAASSRLLISSCQLTITWIADARVLKDTRTMSFVEAEAKNEDGSLVAKAIATVRVRMKEKT